MFKIIKGAFMQRRKTLLNGLINGKILKNKEEVKEIFKKLNFNDNIRGEELTLEQFAQLSNEVNKLIS